MWPDSSGSTDCCSTQDRRAERRADPAMDKPLRALIIDESSDDAELLIRELNREGYDLSFERTGTAAGLQAALDAQPWDVVLCDYTMPHLSGLAALQIVRSHRLDIP